MKVGPRHRSVGKRQKINKSYLITGVLVFLLFCTLSSAFLGIEARSTYHTDMSLAKEGIQHLRTGLTLVEGLSHNPFDAHAVQNAQHEFTSALPIFVQLNNDLKFLPGISTSIPGYGTRISGALHLMPIAIEASQTGIVSCNLMNLLIARFHDPLNAKKQGLTIQDFAIVNQDFRQIKTTLNLITDQVNHLQPSDLQLDPRLSQIVATFRNNVPTLQARLKDAENILSIAPTLLGISTPTNYLIEVLDSTELRPGGGFIGNYGVVTLSGGRLVSAHITDSYLLDVPFVAAGHSIPYPPAYSWFTLAPKSWSFRDSNLDADFPTAARYAEQNYRLEGGKVGVQGVIAITPAFIQGALVITGPIKVPEYKETVTAQNLIDRIHYHQLGVTSDGSSLIPAPDGLSSQRKHFTASLAEHFLARVHHLSPSVLSKFFHLVISAVHSKDIQIYLNSNTAENLLRQLHIDAAIQSSSHDSFMAVDANIGVDKANSYISDTLDDRVTIDTQGNAIHHTTLRYVWLKQGPLYGDSPVYQDYLRIYIPPRSTLLGQSGWQSRGVSKAFGREVWAGYFTLTYGQMDTITFIWKVPGAATKDAKGWHYQYVVQRQAGAQWTLHLQILLPSCAKMTNKLGGLASSNSRMATYARPLDADLNLSVDYVC